MQINTDKGMYVDNSGNILVLIALHVTPLKGPPPLVYPAWAFFLMIGFSYLSL